MPNWNADAELAKLRKLRAAIEDDELAKRLAEESCDRQYGDYIQARAAVRYYRAALLAELEGRE